MAAIPDHVPSVAVGREMVWPHIDTQGISSYAQSHERTDEDNNNETHTIEGMYYG